MRKLLAGLFVVLWSAAGPAAAQAQTPDQLVRTQTDRILERIRANRDEYKRDTRKLYAIARPQPELLGNASSQLQHGRDGASRGDGAFRKRLRTCLDAMHHPVRANEYHIERNERVAHPHGLLARHRVEKQHASAFGQFGAVHEA